MLALVFVLVIVLVVGAVVVIVGVVALFFHSFIVLFQLSCSPPH